MDLLTQDTGRPLDLALQLWMAWSTSKHYHFTESEKIFDVISELSSIFTLKHFGHDM